MMNHLVSGLAPMHPGELFREDILPALNKPKAEIARLLEVSRQTLYDILAEKQDITPTMALRVGKLTGTTPEMWVNMQRNYDLRVQAVKDVDILARIPTLDAACPYLSRCWRLPAARFPTQSVPVDRKRFVSGTRLSVSVD